MRYEILGPLRLVERDESFWISAPKIECLLAVLLTRHDQVIAFDKLISEIWGYEVPKRATAGLHVYVSQLRKFLHREQRADSPIVTRPPGYLLRLGDDQLDVDEFLELSVQGRADTADGALVAAADRLERALALWRGPVLGDQRGGPILDGFATWLNEERLATVESLMDAYLELGRHRALIGRLRSLVTEHPLREGFYHQLMLALYRSDRQADALKVYQDARRTLDTELGLQPCRALQALHRRILQSDHSLDLYAAA